jgi:hypothetical protein
VNAFVLEIWDDEANKVTFYTVRKENAGQNETLEMIMGLLMCCLTDLKMK